VSSTHGASSLRCWAWASARKSCFVAGSLLPAAVFEHGSPERTSRYMKVALVSLHHSIEICYVNIFPPSAAVNCNFLHGHPKQLEKVIPAIDKCNCPHPPAWSTARLVGFESSKHVSSSPMFCVFLCPMEVLEDIPASVMR
jgi:hypothetical protein